MLNLVPIQLWILKSFFFDNFNSKMYMRLLP